MFARSRFDFDCCQRFVELNSFNKINHKPLTITAGFLDLDNDDIARPRAKDASTNEWHKVDLDKAETISYDKVAKYRTTTDDPSDEIIPVTSESTTAGQVANETSTTEATSTKKVPNDTTTETVVSSTTNSHERIFPATISRCLKWIVGKRSLSFYFAPTKC